jgi:hypothetical protein
MRLALILVVPVRRAPWLACSGGGSAPHQPVRVHPPIAARRRGTANRYRRTGAAGLGGHVQVGLLGSWSARARRTGAAGPRAALAPPGSPVANGAPLGARRLARGRKQRGPMESFAARSSRACAASRAPRWGGKKQRAKWLAPWLAEWLREWRAGANAKGAREGARRPRLGSPAAPVARASEG